jgi:hypothetical protein
MILGAGVVKRRRGRLVESWKNSTWSPSLLVPVEGKIYGIHGEYLKRIERRRRELWNQSP